MTNGLHGPKKFSKKVKTKSGRTKTVQVWSERLFDLARNQEGRQLLCPVSWADEEEPESSQEPQLAAPLSRKKWKCSGSKSRRS